MSGITANMVAQLLFQFKKHRSLGVELSSACSRQVRTAHWVNELFMAVYKYLTCAP